VRVTRMDLDGGSGSGSGDMDPGKTGGCTVGGSGAGFGMLLALAGLRRRRR
jgi:hypothetical protein